MADETTTTKSLHENDEDRARGKTQTVNVQKGRTKPEESEDASEE